MFKGNRIFFCNDKRWYLASIHRYEMLHDEVFCIYCGKQHKSIIHRHAWVNIQNWQVLKKVLQKHRNTSPVMLTFCSRFLRYCPTDSCGQMSFITSWLFDCVTGSCLNCHFYIRFFLTLLVLDNCRYQTHKRNCNY